MRLVISTVAASALFALGGCQGTGLGFAQNERQGAILAQQRTIGVTINRGTGQVELLNYGNRDLRNARVRLVNRSGKAYTATVEQLPARGRTTMPANQFRDEQGLPLAKVGVTAAQMLVEGGWVQLLAPIVLG